MKKALILHGMPGKEEYFDPNYDNPSNAHWLPLRYLSENKINIDALVLVAPWIDATGLLSTDFFKFDIDTNITDRINRTILFSSLTDDPAVIESVKIIKEKLPTIKIIEFADKGHFCLSDMGTRAFPELLEEIIK